MFMCLLNPPWKLLKLTSSPGGVHSDTHIIAALLPACMSECVFSVYLLFFPFMSAMLSRAPTSIHCPGKLTLIVLSFAVHGLCRERRHQGQIRAVSSRLLLPTHPHRLHVSVRSQMVARPEPEPCVDASVPIMTDNLISSAIRSPL